VPRRLLLHPVQNLPHIHRHRRSRPSRQRGGDCAHNAVVFEPDQKPRLSGYKTDSMERRYNIVHTEDLSIAKEFMERRMKAAEPVTEV
jgi:hypothetical protein